MAASSAYCWYASTSCWFTHVAELLAVPGLLAIAPAAAVVAAVEGGGEGETHGNRSENQPRMYDQHTFGTAKALTLKIPAAAMAPGLLVLCTLSMPLTPKRLPCGCD